MNAIIITRGGGSIAELSSFDSEKIAVAISQLTVPVLSGIGHEINTTVTDLAAHTFAKTPTAIAKFLVERLRGFVEGVDDRQERIIQALRQVLKDHHQRLKDHAVSLQTQTLGLIKSHQQRLAIITEALQREPLVKFKESKRSLGEAQDHLKKIIYLHLQNSRIKIKHYEKLVHMASPVETLKRGFSITRAQDGRLIRNMKDAKGAKNITTQLVDGLLESEVII